MIFISFLVVTMVTILVNCIIELATLPSDDDLKTKTLNYEFLPRDIVANRAIYIVFNWVIIALTIFFLLPLFLLMYI